MDFDKVLDGHTAAIRTGRKMQLEMLIKEIEEYGYATFSDLNGALWSFHK